MVLGLPGAGLRQVAAPPLVAPQASRRMTRCCPADAIVFGHTMCPLRPAWAVSEAAAEDHDCDDWQQRSLWALEADRELWRARRRARRRGPQIDGAAPGHAGIPGGGPWAVSGDRGAAQTSPAAVGGC